MKKNAFLWLFKMAWRDSRSNRARLFLFMAAIIVGVAAQVAITSFRENLHESVNEQSRELLGADIEIKHNAPFHPNLQAYIDSLGGEESTAVSFNSMAFFPKNRSTRLSQVTALEGGFPFYGELITKPAEAAGNFQQQNTALVDAGILEQLGIQPGDSVRIGFLTYKIGGAILEIPGQPVAASFFGPRIFIPKQNVKETGLLQRGSRLEYISYLKLPAGVAVQDVEKRLDQIRDNTVRFRYETVKERQEEVGEAITYLSNFLNLIGFIALLLGGIGVASSIFAYIRQKISIVAVLRCVGVTSNQALFIFLIQATAMGFIGSALGAALGSAIQIYLPVLVSDFLPVDIDLFISWQAVFIGIITGVAISMIFALYPLLAVRNISPLYTLRSFNQNLNQLSGLLPRIMISLLLFFFVVFYARIMIGEWLPAVFFALGLLICLLLLTAFAKLIMKISRSFIKPGLPYEWRQGLANLYRPNNQTTTLLLTFGLGVTMISSLYLTQDMLLGQIDLGDQSEMPDIAFFDVQYDQNAGVNEIIAEHGHEILQNVPIVTMRLSAVNDSSTTMILEDSSRKIQRWALMREYRSTYRDTLMDSETLIDGEWIGTVRDLSKPVPVSIETEFMQDLNAKIGDTLTWNVQGVEIDSYIASTRSVEWSRPQPNFFVVFPAGVLEAAPHFFATTVKSPNRQQTLSLQQNVIEAYPNVSAIDVSLIINSVRQFIDKITFVIQFIGFFSVITGLIVLAGSAATSRFQRIREAVLLRTLGAQKKQVVKIQVIEYVILGIMASCTGLILSVGASMLIAHFYFNLNFTPNFIIIAIEIAILTLLVLIIGILNTRGIHNKTPLEVLRAEAA